MENQLTGLEQKLDDLLASMEKQEEPAEDEDSTKSNASHGDGLDSSHKK